MSGVVQGLVGDESAFSYEGRTTMAERRAFVVTMEPAAGDAPALLPGFVVDSGRVWLDAESGVVLGMDADFTLDALEMFQALSASGGMPGVPDDLESQDLPDIPPMEGSLRWRVTHVAYDEDLADDLFTFVPPPGAHKVSLSDLGAGETGPGSDGGGPETAPSIAGLPEVNTLNAAAAVLDYPVAELDRFPEGCHEVSVQLRPLMSGVHEPDAYIMAMLDCPAGALLVVEAPSASPPRVSPLEALSRADDFTVVTTGRAGTYIQLGASWATPELLAASDGLQAEDR
jgi:hypothetical protein